MKKTTLSILALTGLLALTGCANNGSGPAPTPKVKTTPTEIELNTRSTAMIVGDTFQIEPFINPLKAYDADLIYESSNPEAVSVDEKGLITAIAEGNAVITVKSEADPTVSKTMKVYSCKKTSSISKELKNMKSYQEEHVTEPKVLRTYEIERRSRYEDGVLAADSISYEEITTDKNNGFFYVGGTDNEMRIDDGAYSRSKFGWYMFTKENYDSYIYHYTDNSKNRMYLPTEFYLGTGVSRGEVVYKILDSLFTSGRDIAENMFEDSMGTDWFGYSMLSKRAGTQSGNCLVVEYAQSMPDTSSPTYEQNLDIPAYIDVLEEDSFRVYWDKGNVRSYNAHFTLSYEWKGKSYVVDINRYYTFERDDEVTIEYPNKNDYQEVYSIYDL